MRKMILLAILVLGFVVPLAAQMDILEDTPILELEGEITVEEGVVLLDGMPLVLPEGVDPESLMEGAVLVSVYLLEDDTLLVISIEYAPEDEMEDDIDDDADDEHPVLSLLAEQFEADYDELVELAEELGVGSVTRALMLADQMDEVELEDVLALLEDGATWGEVKQTYDIHPSELAPGRVVSGRYADDMDDDDGNGRPDNPGNGRPDDNPGNGRPDNPGNGRPDDNPGNGRPDDNLGNGRNK